MELLYGTGLRVADVCGLKVADIEIEQGYLFVKEGKGAKDRVVPLSEGVCGMVGHYLKFVRKTYMAAEVVRDDLFPGKTKHMSTDYVQVRLKHYAGLALITKPVHPHAFRHACATHMLQNGAPIRHVQELLGHASINSTQIYTHITINDLKKAHAKYHPRERMKKKEEVPTR